MALIGLFVIPELLDMIRRGKRRPDASAGVAPSGFNFVGRAHGVLEAVNLIRSASEVSHRYVIPGAAAASRASSPITRRSGPRSRPRPSARAIRRG